MNFKSYPIPYVAERITEIEKKVPIDLIVLTKATNKKFIELGNMFARKIAADGMLIYKKNYRGVAESGNPDGHDHGPTP